MTLELTSSSTPDAQWVGGYFAYGGDGTETTSTTPARRICA